MQFIDLFVLGPSCGKLCSCCRS